MVWHEIMMELSQSEDVEYGFRFDILPREEILFSRILSLLEIKDWWVEIYHSTYTINYFHAWLIKY